MRNIEFSDFTNRLRRNLVGAAFLIVCIRGFNLQIGEASPSFLKVGTLTTEVALWVLFAVVVYHVMAFLLRAFEEYRVWELQLDSGDGSRFQGSRYILPLARQLRSAATTLEKFTEEHGAIREANTKVLITDTDVESLKSVVRSAEEFAQKFHKFPKIVRVRYWVWDIGVAVLVTLVALAFFFSSRLEGIFVPATAS